MTAKILVVDGSDMSLKLLEALLLREYYDVATASTGNEVLEKCRDHQIDVIILDVALPDTDGIELCRRLKTDPDTANIPIVALTALDGADDKIRVLEAGADDFMSKPVTDQHLLTRVKNLARLKMVSDELFQSSSAVSDTDVEAMLVTKLSGRFGGGEDAARILIVDHNEIAAARLRMILGEDYFVDVAHDAQSALIRAIETDYDSIIISTDIASDDPLKFCSQIRTIERTRLIPIILIVNEDEGSLVVRALELGLSDYVMRPLEKFELYARLRTQIKRKCYNDLLRQSLHKTIAMTVTDSLTGLHNRLYLDRHMPVLISRAIERGRPLSVIVIDFDKFKRVNDQYGHDGGDSVLCEFARRLRRRVRNMDVMCRYGGEEFAIILPDTDISAAKLVAMRVSEAVSGQPFTVADNKHKLDMTISIGVASLRLQGDDSVEELFARSEAALNAAKKAGPNQIALSAA